MEAKDKLIYSDFFKKAILKLRNISKSLGIHSVYSGFNNAFRQYYGEDPVRVTQELSQNKIIEIRPVKGGVMIYLSGEAPKSKQEVGKKALTTILDEDYKNNVDLKVILDEINAEVKIFPNDFIDNNLKDEDFNIIELPGLPLVLDGIFPSKVVSKKKHFKYSAKNPVEAKYIIYGNKIEERKMKIPKDNLVVYKAVVEYEKYCERLSKKCFGIILEKTKNEETAEILLKKFLEKLDLKLKNYNFLKTK